MSWSSLYLILGRVSQFLVLLGRGDRVKAIEIVVLRHQVAVLRQVNRPDLQPGVRVVLVSIAGSALREDLATVTFGGVANKRQFGFARVLGCDGSG
ncbi:hypothetical protein Acor_65450 [Acrocarpospora corrugata]|uniref:Uncharacterized protein n=1 Tax=Acrocarpospora corrugata TaxID=35763 RepID=A0A5M3W5Z8_9ACTN|nr:hypothetical protein [Acrocarpospora corrugata]GES04477.1 hypothetical protein Acor_65450 [Acrocarpospora corrugata]